MSAFCAFLNVSVSVFSFPVILFCFILFGCIVKMIHRRYRDKLKQTRAAKLLYDGWQCLGSEIEWA